MPGRLDMAEKSVEVGLAAQKRHEVRQIELEDREGDGHDGGAVQPLLPEGKSIKPESETHAEHIFFCGRNPQKNERKSLELAGVKQQDRVKHQGFDQNFRMKILV